jgi:hypothetical protein
MSERTTATRRLAEGRRGRDGVTAVIPVIPDLPELPDDRPGEAAGADPGPDELVVPVRAVPVRRPRRPVGYQVPVAEPEPVDDVPVAAPRPMWDEPPVVVAAAAPDGVPEASGGFPTAAVLAEPPQVPAGTAPVHRSLYLSALRVRHLNPGVVPRVLLVEGMLVVAVVLVLADLATPWLILVLPFVVAAVVKLHDLVEGAVEGARGRAAGPEGAAPTGGAEPR